MIVAALPMQLTFAALGEASGGYDSTAIDPRSGRYVDAPLLQLAVDAQVTHETDRLRQVLRNRAEAVYTGTGGRDVLDSDVLDIARYSLVWQPNELLQLRTDASYAIGAPTLFFSRAGRPDVSFARRGLAFPHQLVADYLVRQEALIRPNEIDGVQADVTVAGRYPVTSQPRGQNMFTPSATLQWLRDFNEENQGQLGVHGEYLALELFRPVWLLQSYIGWMHHFDESFNFYVQAGVSVVEENLGQDQWDAQPFFRGRAFKRFERQRLMLGLGYTHTFGVVSATLGTGAIDMIDATAWWSPFGPRWLVFANAAWQRGQGADPATATPIDSSYAGTVLGARYAITPWLRAFARYEFQWQSDSTYAATGSPDFVRHVVFAGLQVAFGTDPLATAQMLPFDEFNALDELAGGGDGYAPAPPRRMFEDEDETRRRRRDPDRDETDPMTRDPWSLQPLPGDGTAPGEGTPLPGDALPPEPTDPLNPHPSEGTR